MGGEYNLLASSLTSINPLGMVVRLSNKCSSLSLTFVKLISKVRRFQAINI